MLWIYFVLIDETRIKIGKAEKLQRRLDQHAKTTLSIHDVELLAAVRGCAADEKHVQRYFGDDAVPELKPSNGDTAEVFILTPRLSNYIRWLRNQWFVCVNLDEQTDDTATSEFWYPKTDRQTPPPSDPLFPPDWTEFPRRIITGDDYYTNPAVLDCARKVLGQIDLDPASHPLANRHVKATRFYSFHDNGLNHKWAGRVWLNPPFSQWKLWVPKIAQEWKSGRVQSLCVYSAMRTITAQYFRPLLDLSQGLCVITGRMRCGGKGTVSPDDGHCVFYMGSDVALFIEVFSVIGSTWRKPVG